MNDLLLQNAFMAHQAGNHAEAARMCQDVLRDSPKNYAALSLLGYLCSQSRQFAEAERLLGEAIKIHPTPELIYNRGCALQNLDRHEEALTCFQTALTLKPDFVDAIHNTGIAHLNLGRFEAALGSFDAVLAKLPGDAEAWNNRGNALLELGRAAESLASFDKAIALKPDYANAWCNRAVALQRLNRHSEAIETLERTLIISPRLPAACNNRGSSLMALRRYEDACADFERACTMDSNFIEPVINRATALVALRRLDEALAYYDRALRMRPNGTEVLRNRANALVIQKRVEDAVRDCEAILRIDPDFKYMKGIAAHCRLQCCDWRNYDAVAAEITAGLRSGARVIPPLENMALCRSAADQWLSARIFAADKYPATTEKLWRGERYRHDRIRVAYLSADFRNHAVASLIAGVFEQHTKSRFETIALSFSGDKASPMRARLEPAFDRFLDVERHSDDAIAKLIRDMEIDIAVDLMGYTGECRPGILTFRPAPIQVNYLGYAGTMGAPHLDYIIADPVVIPEEHQPHYSEKIAYLPHSYIPHDSRRARVGTLPTREAVGLPEKGFVFCSFNNSYKFAPDVFGIWMRLLHAIAGSVLWLPQGNAAAMRNLRSEAQMRGVSAERIVFAPYLASGEEHLTRMALADLFLDTLPFNAHTTAMDALWAGLPLLTCRGQTFAGRVAASLLSSLGLPELIADSLESYEARARGLARDAAALSGIRKKLVANRASSPLFDTQRFTRDLETAYVTMWERQQRGERPENFAVPNAIAPAL